MTDVLLKLEEGFWKAAGDGEFYREHMVANGLCVLPVGVLNREATVDAVAESPPWDEVELSDITMLDWVTTRPPCAIEPRRGGTIKVTMSL